MRQARWRGRNFMALIVGRTTACLDEPLLYLILEQLGFPGGELWRFVTDCFLRGAESQLIYRACTDLVGG